MISDRSKVQSGTVLCVLFKGKYYECLVVAGNLPNELGFMLQNGDTYRSISQAGEVLRGGIATNGWQWWWIKAELGENPEQWLRERSAKPVRLPQLAARLREEAAEHKVRSAEWGRMAAAESAARKRQRSLNAQKHNNLRNGFSSMERANRKAFGQPVGLIRKFRVIVKFKRDSPACEGLAEGMARWCCTACVDWFDESERVTQPIQCPLGHPAFMDVYDNPLGVGRSADEAARDLLQEFWSVDDALAYAMNGEGRDEDLDNTELELDTESDVAEESIEDSNQASRESRAPIKLTL